MQDGKLEIHENALCQLSADLIISCIYYMLTWLRKGSKSQN